MTRDRAFALTARWATLIVGGIGLLALAGWAFDLALLKSVEPQWIAMRVLTAVCFVLAAVELTLVLRNPGLVRSHPVLRVPGWLVALVGLSIVALYAVRLITGQDAPPRDVPLLGLIWDPQNRPALLTGILFLLTGCALGLLSTARRGAAGAAHALALAVATGGYFVTASYFLGVESIHDWLGRPVALNTGIAFCAVAAAIFAMRRDTWLLGVFAGDQAGSVIARRLLPVFLLVPLVIGWLRLFGERAGLFGSEVGVELVAVTYALLLVGLVWLAARSVNRTDERRLTAERQFRRLIELAPLPLLRANRGGSIVYFNERFTSVFGYTHEDIPSVEEWWRRAQPEESTRRRLAETWDAALKRGAAEQAGIGPFECSFTCKDGSARVMEISATTIGDDLLATFVDLTERKRAEESLRELNLSLEGRVVERTAELERANAYNRNLLETSLDPLVTINPEGKITDVNEATVKVTGVSRDKLIGTDFSDYFTEPEKAKEGYRKVFAQGSVTDYPLTIRNEDSRLTDVLYNASVYGDTQGHVLGVFAAARDITERKRAEDALRASEFRYRTLFETMDQGFCVVEMLYDPEGKPVDYRFVEVNPAFEKHTGLHAALGKTIRELVPDHEAHWFEIYGRVARTGEAHRFQNVAEAMQRYFDVFAFPIGEAENRRVGILFTDITDKKRAEAALQEAYETLEHRVAERTAELARSNKSLEEFAYVTSHDLQEPLRMMASYSELLERRYREKLDADATDFLDYIVDGAKRMQRLINDLLAYSRVGRTDMEFEPVDCEAVLAQVTRGMAPALEESGARLTHDRLPVVMGREGRLAQLFQNLIGNAIKFRGVEAPRVHVGAARLDGEWVFSVKDNGIGIEPQYHDRIFVIFQRLHGREKYAGTGIGLAICKKIVETHGGRIWVESENGKGSTFYFTIPTEREGGDATHG
ncbi:MAG: PAS domain S-box protein [Acidobacteriia bacterium]|nr:PAS domain S-box protein [Terriglobia bacterium]